LNYFLIYFSPFNLKKKQQQKKAVILKLAPQTSLNQISLNQALIGIAIIQLKRLIKPSRW